ncbi:hypothetical protein CKO25_15945 [Thiocapsa imhoffii]|uniref:CobB/CobQ-like glutamine amidotransferase domain-containing protein n=1 Tax=Thiocapsa imhoffii TaxID=382777 RepID=A0A9X1BAB4_9GAMM|nr:hypothetical protein [Thiocapsa imhoffii]
MPPPRHLAGRCIAVARDAAFSFIYPDNLTVLEAMGARIETFSPLANEIPVADAIYLPGGYPELHLATLAARTATRDALHAHARAGRPIYAECGGLLYLLEHLIDRDGRGASMVGLLPGRAQMQPRLVGLGMQSLEQPAGQLRGHSFHHSALDLQLEPERHAVHHPDGRPGEAFYRHGAVRASYLHLYFPSCPTAAAALFLP